MRRTLLFPASPPNLAQRKKVSSHSKLTVQLRRVAAQHSPGKEGDPSSSGRKRFCQEDQNSFGWAATPRLKLL